MRHRLLFCTPLLLLTPLTVTTMLAAPFGNPDGTVAMIDLFPQLVVEATTPPNVIVLVPFVFPKPLPLASPSTVSRCSKPPMPA